MLVGVHEVVAWKWGIEEVAASFWVDDCGDGIRLNGAIWCSAAEQ